MPGTPDFTKKQQDWIESVIGSAEAAENARSHAAARSKGADLVEERLQWMRDDIRDGQSYEIEKLPKSALAAMAAKLGMVSKMSSIDPDGDPMKEIDSWHDLPGSKALSAEEVATIMASMQKIIGIQEEMKGVTDDNGRHVYQPDPTMAEIEKADELERTRIAALDDPEEKARALAKADETLADARANYNAALPDCNRRLSEDLWQPLMREGLIPENAIPSEFSEVDRTFTAAAEGYNARLQEYSAELDEPAKIYAKLDPVLHVGEDLLKSASAFAGMSAAIDPGVASNAKEAKKSLDLVKLCVSSVHTGAEKALSARDAFGVVDAMNTMLVGILTQEVGKETAALVGKIITASARGVRMADHLRLGQFDQALDDIGDAVGAGMSTSGDPAIASAGTYLKGAFKLLGGSVKSLDQRDPKKLVAGAMAAMRTIAERESIKAAQAIRDDLTKRIQSNDSYDDKKKETMIAALGSGTPKIKGLDKVEKGVDALAALESVNAMIASNIDEDAVQQLEDKAQKTQEAEMMDFALRPDDAFEAMLENGFSEPADDEEAAVQDLERKANDIERLIAVQKRDQAVFDLSRNIMSGGTTFVQSLLPAAGIAVVANQLVFSIMEAVKHAKQMEIWRANLADAKAAKTVQVDAMLSRMGLETTQATQANIKVALQAISLIGKALELAAASGVGAPIGAVGTAMSAGAQGAEALMDVALKVKTEAEMARAWKLYRKALDTPQDRKLARESLRTNPTLSKYAMAYGAVIDKNPVARKAMERCGLNANTLAEPSANVGTVVRYLETIYKDDPVLLRAVPVEKAWYPGKPDLTVASFGQFFIAGMKKAEPKIAKQDVSKINATLFAYERARDEAKDQLEASYTPKPSDKTGPLEEVSIAAGDLMLALGRYDPLDEDGQPHDEMIEYRDAMVAQTEIARREVRKILEAIHAERSEAADVH